MADLESVKAVIRLAEQLWNRQDYAGLRQLWDDEEPEPWYVAEEVETSMVGMDAIERYWAANVDLISRIAVRYFNIRVKPFGTEGAVAMYDMHFDLKLAGPRKPIGGDNRVIALLRRKADSWLYTSYVEAPISPIVYVRRLYEQSVDVDFRKSLGTTDSPI